MRTMKLWSVDFKMADENGIWETEHVIAKDYKEATEKALKVCESNNGDLTNKLKITKIEEIDYVDAI